MRCCPGCTRDPFRSLDFAHRFVCRLSVCSVLAARCILFHFRFPAINSRFETIFFWRRRFFYFFINESTRFFLLQSGRKNPKLNVKIHFSDSWPHRHCHQWSRVKSIEREKNDPINYFAAEKEHGKTTSSTAHKLKYTRVYRRYVCHGIQAARPMSFPKNIQNMKYDYFTSTSNGSCARTFYVCEDSSSSP